ncbi:hypothetical protein EMIT0158MI4_170027 [Burkholderia ambifaria]
MLSPEQYGENVRGATYVCSSSLESASMIVTYAVSRVCQSGRTKRHTEPVLGVRHAIWFLSAIEDLLHDTFHSRASSGFC